MHRRPIPLKMPFWLLGLLVVSCGGRTVDPDSGTSTGTGGATGSATSGSTTGSTGAGTTGSTGGNGATTSGGTTTGSGGSSDSTSGGSGFTSGGFTGGTTTTTGSGGSSGSTSGGSGFTSGGFTGGTTTTTGSGGSGGAPCGATPGGGGSSGTAGWAGSGGSGTGFDGGSTECLCTRRPGPGTSLKCPAGIDESTAMVVGTAGGKLTLAGRQGNGVPSSLTIPPKAFDRDVTITLVETSIPPPKEFVDWSPIWEVLPSCLTSFSRMTLRLPWSNRDGLVGPITIYRAKDRNSPFVPLPEAYGNAGFSDGAITEGGLFFVGYPKSPEQATCP